MSVHYKFKSSKDKHTVIFDGLHISVADLKKAIMNQRKIGKTNDLDLQLTNQQTGEVYETDSTLIPKNTTVDVARVPVTGNQKKSWDRNENSLKSQSNSGSHIEVDIITKSSNLSTSYGTEDEKIKAMMSQSTQEYEPSKYVKNRGLVGPLPSNYTCYRCGQPGHYIKQCPTNNSDVKRSTGIPRSFMIPASAQQKGALLTASGEYAVPIIDHEAYKEVKKEKPPFLPNNESESEVVLPEIPDDLKCSLCQNLLHEAVLIPCCGNSYCDECVRTYLLESETHQCPTCHENNVSPDTLIPNRFLRLSVNKFKNETGYEKINYNISNNDIKPEISQSKPETIEQIKEVDVKDVLETDSIDFEDKLDINQSKVEPEIQNSSDVTLDEVILDLPKPEIQKPDLEPQKEPIIQSTVESNLEELEETNDSIADANESQTATGSNTPLVDEPLDSFEASDEQQSNQTQVNTIESLAHYQNHSMQGMAPYVRPQQMLVQGPIRPIRTTLGQQSAHNQMSRPPILGPPRGLYGHPRPQDPRFYGRPMTDPRGYPMGLGPVPPFTYQQHIRQHTYHDPYGYMGPRSHMPTVPMHHTLGLHQGMAEAPPPGTAPLVSDNIYYSKPDYDDYEDRVNRFTRQLESRPPKRRPKPRSRTRSPSRSPSRSRSRSSSSSSSTSSSSSSSRFSFSSKSFSGSSRSRSYSPRRRSTSRGRYRRRSRSKYSRHNYNRETRYRRSRSPHEGYHRRGYRSRRVYETNSNSNSNRDRDDYHRDYRSAGNRYDDRYKDKDTKVSHSSRSNHKSTQEKVSSREKHVTSDDKRHKTRTDSPNKDNTVSAQDINTKPESNELITDKKDIELDSNKQIIINNENNNEVMEKSNELNAENDKMDENYKKKDKEKSRKHHKHHHKRHHKEVDNNKSNKVSDESKSISKKKHKHKKHNKSENVTKTEATDVLEEETNDNSIADSNSKPTIDSEEAVVEQTLDMNEFETNLEPNIEIENKTEVNDNLIISNNNTINEELNNYEIITDKPMETDAELIELNAISEIPVYETVEFSTQKSFEEILDNKQSLPPIQTLKLVDYTDNEEMGEDLRNQNVSDINELNDNLNQINDKTTEFGAKLAIEVPKSKWDEEFNDDLKLEEDYSDFDDNMKPDGGPKPDLKPINSLPNDILEKAEKAILEKPLRVAVVLKKDKTSDSKTSKTSKSSERDKKSMELRDNYRRDRERDKNTDKTSRVDSIESKSDPNSSELRDNYRRDRDRDRNADKVSKSDSIDSKSDQLFNDSNDKNPRKVKINRSKFAEKPTISITIDNSEKELRNSSHRSDDKISSSRHSSDYHKSSRDRTKDSLRTDSKSSKESKRSSRNDSRDRSHNKRSSRSPSRSSTSHKRVKNERDSHSKSKSKSNSSKKSK